MYTMRNRRAVLIACMMLAVLALAFAGCAKKDKKIITESGLQIEDIKVGTGAEAKLGATVTVHYVNWINDGTQKISTRDTDQPLVFPIGVGAIIKGLDEGVTGMKVGGVRKLVIPPALGFGDKGAGEMIPPNATLTFEVELIDVK